MKSDEKIAIRDDEKIIIIASLIFGGVAVLLAFVSAVLFFFGAAITTALGIISTIMSVLLSIGAMLYAYFSGKKTLELLNKIEAQNIKLIDKITLELLKDAYDDPGLEDARASKFSH
jgi:hypothetical protein